MKINLRIDRLTRRHQAFGHTHLEATEWVASVDEQNAQRIAMNRHAAKRVFRWDAA